MNSSDVMGKALNSVLFSKTTQMYTEFWWRLEFHSHRCGWLCMIMIFTPITPRKCNNFCHIMLHTILQMTGRTATPYYILFMDEAQFHHDGITNTRNLHSSSHENPFKKYSSSYRKNVGTTWWSPNPFQQQGLQTTWMQIIKKGDQLCGQLGCQTWPLDFFYRAAWNEV